MSGSNPQQGDVLAGKYRVEQVLGVGGMGAVVSAHHQQLDQKVAIKYLLPDALKNPEVVARFAREARAAAKIRGEHVARVIDVGQFDDGSPYMVMEYLEGHDLAHELQAHGPLRVEDAVRYLLEACEALAQAHAARIVHRDLKPSNLFLADQPDKRAIVKVLDFGISKVEDAASNAALTKTSALMGTAFYMSPEQMTTPKAVDHRSDIWALGVILYELLAGVPPFTGESVPEIVAAILQNQPRRLQELRPDAPEGIEAVIVTCMRSRPQDRYASVAKLASALSPFAAPADRASVEAIARVLGEEVAPPSAELAATALQGRGAPTSQARSVSSRTALLEGERSVVTSASPSPAAVTTHGLSSSTITPKKGRPVLPVVVGAVVFLGAAVGGVYLATKREAPAPPAAGLVETEPTAEPSSIELPPPEPPPERTATAAPSPAPEVDVPTSVEPSTDRAAKSHAQGGARATASPKPKADAKATPSATTANSATAAASAAPTTPPKPEATAKTNPLQMGIK